MANKHSRLLHKVEIVTDEPVKTAIPAVVEQVEEPMVEPELEMGGEGELLGMDIESSQESGGKLVWVVVGILVAVAVAVVGIVVVMYSSQRKEIVPIDPTQEVPTITTSPTVPGVTIIPSPTLVKLDLSKIKVQVLNGSGKKGEANVVANLLTAVGFKEIDTGNAKSFDFSTTLIESKTGVIPDELTEALKGYKTKVEELTKDSKYDIVITVGSTKL